MEDRRLSALQSRLASAKEMTISGNDAYKIYLKLWRCDELQEENIRLRRVIKEIKDKINMARI